MNGLLLGIVGGAASALLFAAVTSGGALGTPLFFLSAFPVAIVSIGWGTLAGSGAVLAAAVGLWVFLTWKAALMHILVVAAPMAFYGYLLGLGRPLDTDGKSYEWYPLARVFTAMVIVTAVSIIAAGVFVGFETRAMARDIADMLDAMGEASGDIGAASGTADAPVPGDLLPAIMFYMRLMPFVLAMFWLVLSAVNLWLGSRVVRMSGRLRRGDDRIADTLALPRWMIAVFALALPLTLLDSGIGLIAGVVAGAVGMGFALVGFAVLHVHVRGNPAAPLILGATYATTFVLSIPLVPLAIAGILDGPLGLRARRLSQRPDA